MRDPDRYVIVAAAFITGVTPSSLKKSRLGALGAGFAAVNVSIVMALPKAAPATGSIDRFLIASLRFS
jgi:hypothetical protein